MRGLMLAACCLVAVAILPLWGAKAHAGDQVVAELEAFDGCYGDHHVAGLVADDCVLAVHDSHDRGLLRRELFRERQLRRELIRERQLRRELRRRGIVERAIRLHQLRRDLRSERLRRALRRGYR